MSSLRIRGLLVSGGGVGPNTIVNVTAVVHNMTPFRIGYGQYPSCQTKREGHSSSYSLPEASSNTLPYIVKRFQRLELPGDLQRSKLGMV